jgi:hypothetical protein
MKEFMQGEGGRGFNFAGSGTQVDPRHTVPAQLRNVSDRVRAVIGRGLKDAQYGGNVVNAANIELGKETPLTGTGYRATTTGVRVMDTPQGPMAFEKDGTGKWKQVPYDKTKHGLEKEKLEPGDEKHKILMDPAFAADLEKAFRILGLRESGETKDKKGNPLPTEREVRNRMIKLYPAIHKDIDDMLREDGSGEVTFTVGGKTFKW